MGEVFAGRYELADPIGRGGVGAVWRAWDHRRRRYVAAKVLQQRDAHALLRFVREQALRIDHPHVLAPASWAADDDQVLFTMDLVAGGSLVHLVSDYGPLPPLFVCTLLDQLLSGLAAVHAEGVVHRDIKPANVLLEATGTGRPRLRLSDFGIAMRFGEPRLTDTDLVVGTPGYLAPEQMLGADPDYPADLFAVGLLALHLLEGAKPDAKAIVRYFMEHGTPAPPKSVPAPLWQVVATLLQPDPEARFRTATGARKALAAAVELLQEPGPDDEPIEIFDQLGPLPKGFGPDGPLVPAPGVRGRRPGARNGLDDGASTGSATGRARERAVGAGSVASDPRSDDSWTGRSTPEPVSAPAPAPASSQASQPAQPTQHSEHSQPSMSDTGSFHLPPPRPAAPDLQPDRTGASAPPTTRRTTPEPAPTPTPGLARAPGEAAAPTPPHPRSAPQPPSAPHSAPQPAPQSAPEPYRQPLPPQQASPQASPQVSPQSAPRSGAAPSPHAPWPPALSSPARPLPPDLPPALPPDPATAEYTAQAATAPFPADPTPTPTPVTTPIPHAAGRAAAPAASRAAPHTPAHATPHRRARRRPGPPARVAIPVLLLALACYAVGFWALARV
ncbi:protein kinase [Streptomyces sp. NPDC090108]|uniref:serine/threonine-protein kinase n=1 Tax=Streptomyces sp. NPDC090108 TaxID=3365947 RepID=UPI003822F264